jgi:hypothetical protein
VKPISQCRLERACIKQGEPLGGGKGNGRMGGGGLVYSQPGTRVDGNSRHDIKEGFPNK